MCAGMRRDRRSRVNLRSGGHGLAGRVTGNTLDGSLAVKVTRRSLLKSAAATAAGAIAGGTAVPVFDYVTRPRPNANIVLIVVDALRPDHLGCYGYSRPTSPNIDALASGSTVYLRNKAQSSLTAPSMSSLFTGRLLLTHFIPEWTSSLPEILESCGYRTIAVQTNPWLDTRRGFTRGFDSYNYLVPEGTKETLLDWNKKEHSGSNPFYTDAAGVTQAVKSALDSVIIKPPPLPSASSNSALSGRVSPYPTAERFFLYIHYMDVHGPYIPKDAYDTFSAAPSSFGEKLRISQSFVNTGLQGAGQDAARLKDAAIALYDGEIREADDSIGSVLKMLKDMGLYEGAMIVLTSDHGEAFGEHGQVQHGGSLYETQIHTPLIIKSPGQRANAESKILTRHIDVVPTVLGACGFRRRHMARYRLRGRPLQDASFDESEISRAALVMSSDSGTHSYFAVEKEGFKLIAQADDQDGVKKERMMLFNLWADPAETTDLSAGQASKIAELLWDLPSGGKLKVAAADLTKPVSREQEDRLRSIGYFQ